MTATWTIDDNGDPVGPSGHVLDLGTLAHAWHEAEVVTYDDHTALVADVRAARLADDMAAVIRRLDDGWRIAHRGKADPRWEKGGGFTAYHLLDEPMTPGEVAALHHARQEDG
jgi:hypothetical protein